MPALRKAPSDHGGCWESRSTPGNRLGVTPLCLSERETVEEGQTLVFSSLLCAASFALSDALRAKVLFCCTERCFVKQGMLFFWERREGEDVKQMRANLGTNAGFDITTLSRMKVENQARAKGDREGLVRVRKRKRPPTMSHLIHPAQDTIQTGRRFANWRLGAAIRAFLPATSNGARPLDVAQRGMNRCLLFAMEKVMLVRWEASFQSALMMEGGVTGKVQPRRKHRHPRKKKLKWMTGRLTTAVTAAGGGGAQEEERKQREREKKKARSFSTHGEERRRNKGPGQPNQPRSVTHPRRPALYECG